MIQDPVLSNLNFECTQKHLFLTQKGINQKFRNNSRSIWETFGDFGQTYYPCFYHTEGLSHNNQQTINNSTQEKSKFESKNSHHNSRISKQERIQQLQKKTLITPPPQKQGQQVKIEKPSLLVKEEKKQIRPKSVKFHHNEQILNSQQKNQNTKTLQLAAEAKMTPQERQEYNKKRIQFLKQCYSINQYLKLNKAETRQLANSAIKLFYQRPCLQSYGRGNVSGNSGFIYNNFMKTHNVLPHRLGNEPKKYQSFRGALNYCKRSKFDPQQRWKKIHRQMSKKLNIKLLAEHFAQGFINVTQQNLQNILNMNINKIDGQIFKRSKSMEKLSGIPGSIHFNYDEEEILQKKVDLNATKATESLKQNTSQRINSLRRSKSWGKKQYKFLYKYTNNQGQSHYSKDRHGITCYVTPQFQQNQQAYLKFIRNTNSLFEEDVKPEDKNIDQKLVKNFVTSKLNTLPKHYLLPNCDEPQSYRAEKYSLKGRRKNFSQSYQNKN